MLWPQSVDTFETVFFNCSFNAMTGSKSLGQSEMAVSLDIRKMYSASRLQYLCGTPNKATNNFFTAISK